MKKIKTKWVNEWLKARWNKFIKAGQNEFVGRISSRHFHSKLIFCNNGHILATAQSSSPVLATSSEEWGWKTDAEKVRAHRQVSVVETSAVPLRRLHVQSEDTGNTGRRKFTGKIQNNFGDNFFTKKKIFKSEN